MKQDAKYCYEILGLDSGASHEQIKKAWRDLATQWHPDKVSHNPKLQAIAQEEMKSINAAYEFLRQYQPASQEPNSSAKAQAEEKRERDDEEKRLKEEKERRERKARQEEREAERLRVQQEAEAIYEREQLAKAKEEAKRKEEAAKRLRAQEEAKAALLPYEAVYIVAPDLTDFEIASIVAKYRQIAEVNGGVVNNIDVWERRRLTYQIKGYDEGIYIVMNFNGSPQTEAELRQVFFVSEDQIRFLIVRSDNDDIA